MHFPKKHRKDSPPVLPTTEKSSSYDGVSEEEQHRKDSSISATPARKWEPTRTPSVQVKAPARTASHASHKPSNVHRGPSTRSQHAQRPGLQRRRTTAHTRYIDMLLGLDDVSPFHNILASLFVWILLAGYIVFPATFTKLHADKMDDKVNTNLEQHALNTVRNVPLLYVAAFACGIGVTGCLWLWWRHRKNYVWVINRIFLPALLNSIAGLVSTIVNVYSAQDGQYSVTAKVTIVVTAACSAVTAALFLFYNMVMLKLVKRKHGREVRDAERMGSDGDVVLERERGVYTSRGV